MRMPNQSACFVVGILGARVNKFYKMKHDIQWFSDKYTVYVVDLMLNTF